MARSKDINELSLDMHLESFENDGNNHFYQVN